MVVTIKILANSQSVNKIVLCMPINFTSTIYRRKSNAAIKLHTASTVSIADQLQLLSMRGSGKIGIEESRAAGSHDWRALAYARQRRCRLGWMFTKWNNPRRESADKASDRLDACNGLRSLARGVGS